MKTVSQFLSERYLNLFSSEEKKSEADAVWELIQQSYAPIGGIKGSGFDSKEDMIQNIPFWKCVRKSGKIVAVALYKDKQGRKRVAIGTDGTEVGKNSVRKIVAEDFSRAYVEVSGPSFFSMVKHLGIEFLKKYVKTPGEAQTLLGEKLSEPSQSDPMVQKVPEFKEYMYSREIGGHQHTKIMLGTSGNKIVVSE